MLTDARRLAAVERARRVLPALPMPLDAIAALAARLLGAPMGTVTFVGRHEEYFVGVHGLPPGLAGERHAPLAYSVCKYMVSEDAPVRSPDMAAEDDPALREHPLLTEFGVRAFLGVPLRDADDQPVGSLSVLDGEARQWSDADLSTLMEISHLLSLFPAPAQRAACPVTAALDPQALVEGMKEAFVAVDRRGVVVEFNRAAQELLGWPADEVRGRPLDHTVLPDYDGRPVGEALSRLFAAPAARAVPHRVSVRHRDGRRLPARMVLSVVRGTLGALACAFITDLSEQDAAESDAERQRRFLAALLDSLDVGVAAVDSAGTPVVVNRALRRVHGIGDRWSAEDVTRAVGSSVRDLDGTPLPLSGTPLLRALRGEHVRGADVLVRMPGSADRIMVAHAQPITTAGGTRMGAVAALHDVTAVRRAEGFRACEQQVRQILAAAATVGDAAAATLRAVAEALGWPHAELWLIDSLTGHMQRTGHWSASAGQCGDLHADPVSRGAGVIGTVWETGQPLWVPDIAGATDLAAEHSVARAQDCARMGLHTVLAVPIRDGAAMLGVLVCYSAAPEYDRDLLTVLVGGVAAQFGMFVALRRTADLAEKLKRTRNDFLTLVGHELRTPLTSITSYAGLLAEDPAVPAAEARQMLLVIARNADRLGAVVSDLLELSGLEAGHLRLAVGEHDLAVVVAAAVAAAQPIAADAGVRLYARLPRRLMVHGDPVRLRQAVDNLLSNAIRYSRHGGDVRVRLTAQPDMAELRITDTGIGIPPGEHDDLFHRFTRASNVAHHGFPGAGLGLALVHTIITLHHGDLMFDTGHRPGTSVLLRLPRRQPAPRG
ncbi:GAF domain-containing protein [Actinoplanes teichomyceticus]|uniref:GAF domain-containing protein n=1 Tax=Actinoplanes teichomyceticus TaxID=1867 RepID=UPI0013DDF938|nr:GAF domain-containing protein [Actinoplanes teichomyceticus]